MNPQEQTLCNFNENQTNVIKKKSWMLSTKWWPFGLSLSMSTLPSYCAWYSEQNRELTLLSLLILSKQLVANSPAITHWPIGISMRFWISNFQVDFSNWCLKYVMWNCSHLIGPYWWKVNIGSGYDLMLWGSQCLPRSASTYGITRLQWIN